MKKIIASLIIGLSSMAVFDAQAIHSYQDPVPFKGYVKDIGPLLERVMKRNHWQLSKDDSGSYFADLNYKDYQVKAKILVQDETLAIELISAQRPNCTKRSCKVDEDTVDDWLVRLRKQIGLDITKAVRDDALRKSFM